MKVMITGAAGRLGQKVVAQLHKAGMQVVATDKKYTQNLPVPLSVVDLNQEMPVYDLLDGCQAVVHLGNIPHLDKNYSPQDLYTQNISSNANVFQAAVDLGVKCLVFASSIQAFAGQNRSTQLGAPSQVQYLPMDGNARPNPANLYGLSKVAGEQMLRFYSAANPDGCFTAIRFPYLAPENFRQKLRQDKSEIHKQAIIDELFSYLPIDDAAKLVQAVIENPEPGYHQLFPAARENLLGQSARELIQRYFPDVPLKIPAAQIESLVDPSEIKQLFGWQAQATLF